MAWSRIVAGYQVAGRCYKNDDSPRKGGVCWFGRLPAPTGTLETKDKDGNHLKPAIRVKWNKLNKINSEPRPKQEILAGFVSHKFKNSNRGHRFLTVVTTEVDTR